MYWVPHLQNENKHTSDGLLCGSNYVNNRKMLTQCLAQNQNRMLALIVSIDPQ